MTTNLQVCRDCGGGAPIDAHFCPQCTKILSLGRHGDYFAFMGLPHKLNLDTEELERRFRSLSRQFHPDFFYNATTAERRASLERSSYLNDAYRTLRDPASRLQYLLQMEGQAPQGHDATRKVPPALLEEVFALNEELDEIRDLRDGGAPEADWHARLERARQPIEAKRAAHEAELEALSATWDAGGGPEVLAALRDRFLERNYIQNLLESIERQAKSVL